MSADPFLRLTDVVVTLGRTPVLTGLSLQADVGRVTALLGPNGAGKTTTLRCVIGLLRPTSGSIEILGRPAGDPDAMVRLGLMPQSTGAWSGIRPRELLRYLASLYAHPQPIDALVEALAIGPFLTTPYRQLSGGQQQAVNLAGALIGRPEAVVLDEPTAGMDPHARRRARALIRALADAGVGVLLTTHAMDEAADLADHVWIMDGGRIAVDGTVAELTRDGSLEDTFLRYTREGS
ncbi:MAG: ABC transporter ATP-binding protein [Propioniciclava sp.]